MAFRILKHSTTADASDVNDNFFWGGQGSILPMDGASLAYTTGAVDLGSSAYKWDTLYCGTVTADEIHSGGILYEYVERVSIDAPTTTMITTNINGDDSNEYLVVFYFVKPTATTHHYKLHLNGSIGSMTIKYFLNAGGVGVGKVVNSTGLICFNDSTQTISSYSYGFVSIKSESTNHSMVHFQTSGGNPGVNGETLIGSGIDIDNNKTLTSIHIVCTEPFTTTTRTFQANSYIDVWRTPH